MATPWRNRIVGSADVAPDQLLANPANWRRHPGPQRDAIRGSLSEVGWVRQVLVNVTTGHTVDGHARVEEALSKGEETVPVLYVDLTEEEEALVLATLDPIAGLASRDDAALGALLEGISTQDAGLTALLEQIGSRDPLGPFGPSAPPDSTNVYTSVADVPHYRIVGERPEPETLYDETRAEELRAAIDAARLPAPVRTFLLAAANRHVVFDYRLIAEFYAHAPAPVQRLMEDSALVIVDVDDAIRSGYVRITSLIEELEERDRA